MIRPRLPRVLTLDMLSAVRALRVIQERVRAGVAAVQGDAAEVARRGHWEMDGVVSRALVGRPAACAAGCHYCCHVHVDATLAEVSAVARYVRENFDGAFVERLAAQVARVGELDHDARWTAKIPCALLGQDGRCTIYEVRPLRCRAFHSYSLDACREAFAGGEPDLETSHVLDRSCDAAERGFDRALEDRGLSSAPVLLESALLAELRS